MPCRSRPGSGLARPARSNHPGRRQPGVAVCLGSAAQGRSSRPWGPSWPLYGEKPAPNSTAEETDAAPIQPLDPRPSMTPVVGPSMAPGGYCPRAGVWLPSSRRCGASARTGNRPDEEIHKKTKRFLIPAGLVKPGETPTGMANGDSLALSFTHSLLGSVFSGPRIMRTG